MKRIKPGDEIRVAGESEVATVEVQELEPFRVQVKSTRVATQPAHKLVLLQAVTRKKKFEEIVKIGTELGITDFYPLVSEHTVRVPNNPEKQNRRWRKIALDSARITGQDWTPKIHPLTKISEVYEELNGINLYFGDREGKNANSAFSKEEEEGALVVGPEGGFTSKEIDNLVSEGAEPLSLGPRNYRSETASIILSTIWLQRNNYYNLA